MPGHYDKAKDMGAMDRVAAKNMVKKMTENKKKPVKVFEKMPPNSHKMPGGIIMSGKTHSSSSKPIGILGKKKKGKKEQPKKGSEEMKKRMAKLRAMKKKK